jgi:hypothetical protein
MEQKVSFSNGNDTMKFVSEEVYIYENYTEEYGQLFCKCGEPAPCLPIYVIFGLMVKKYDKNAAKLLNGQKV